ncbi:MAG: hypothetical protein U5N85_20235 [Arcicella sp.]|nr:hypothetical protein [Arcicella sp.]
MEENQEFIKNGEQKALIIARLLQLIEMNTNTLKRHREAESPLSIIEQYKEIRDRYLSELAEVMRGFGVTAKFMPLDLAA